MDSRFQEEDKDEWIYNSMKKYSNLSMFELEWSPDTIEVIGNTSLCLSGVQPYSKKCEILELFIPPKLFPKGTEESLIKDRDFQIVSGGYASNRILQIKPIKDSSVVACTQVGENGVTLYKLGNKDYAVINELQKLSISSEPLGSSTSSPGVITSSSTKIMLGSSSSSFIYEWDTSSSCGLYPLIKYPLSRGGGISKIKFWDQNLLTFLTDSGPTYMYDLRQPPHQLEVSSFIPSKSSENQEASGSGTSAEVLFTFDTIPSQNVVAILDSYGGYERFDLRMTSSRSRLVLPFPNAGVLRDKFNIEFSPWPNSGSMKEEEDTRNKNFIISGLKQQLVYVVEEQEDNLSLKQIFVHDGHTKTVTGALFHPNVERNTILIN